MWKKVLWLTRERETEARIIDFGEIWRKCIFQKNIWSVFSFNRQSSVLNEWKLPSVGDTEHILSNISEIIEDTVSV